jgi:hypothetical protein
MAEKFDISEHIKVEALGIRIAEVISPTELEVNGKTFPYADYSVTPLDLESGTELFPIEDMDYPYIVEWRGTSIFVVWKAVSGATSYRYYNGSSSTPSSYTTVASGDFGVVLNRVGGTTTFFKFQALVGGTWTDFIAQANGSTYSYNSASGTSYQGWYYPDTSLNSTIGWRAGGSYFDRTFTTPAPESLVDAGSNFYKLRFFPKAADTAESIPFTDKDRYLIGISGSGEYYPQFYVTPRAFVAGDLSLYLEDVYEVYIPSTYIDPNSTKFTVSILKTDDTTVVRTELFHGPEPISDHVDLSDVLTLKREVGTYQAGTNMSFSQGYNYLNFHNGNCTWTRDSRTLTDLTNNFDVPSVGYAMYHENRAVDNFSPSDDLKTTGTLVATYDSRTITSTNLAIDYFPSGYNKFALYPLIYTDYTTSNQISYSNLTSSDFVPSATIRKTDYKAILTMEFKNWNNSYTGLRAVATWFPVVGGTQSPQVLIAQATAITDNTTVNYEITGTPGAITANNTITLSSWNGSQWVQIASIQILAEDIYEIGDTVYAYQTVFTYDENYTLGVSSLGSGTYELSFYNSLAGRTYYISSTNAAKYPQFNVTVPAIGVVKVDLPGLPEDFVLNVVYNDSEVLHEFIVGEPYAFVYGDFVYASGWWPIECSTSSVDINTGYNEERGLLRRPEPGFATIELKGSEGDPRSNSALQLDNKVRILLAEAAAPDDEEDYLFTGFIESMSTTYDTFGNANTTLNLVDSMSRVLNVNIPTYEVNDAESFSDRMFRVLDEYVSPATWGVTYDTSIYETFQPYDGSVFPIEFRENVTSSDIITELTEGEFGIMGQNRGGVIFWFNRNARALIYAANEDLVLEPFDFGFSTAHSDSLDHFCISDFIISNSMNDITNKVIATLTYDELTSATYSDAASITRYGERSFDVALNLDAPAGNPAQYLESWIEEVPYFEDQSELQSLTTNVVNREGYVTRAYKVDALIDPIRVFISTGPVAVNGVWFAKRVTHNITPENWTMTLDLTSN